MSTLASLVEETGLADALNADSAEGLTVFAPTNEAFAVLDALPEGDALTALLNYHVVEGTLNSAALADEDLLSTLSGEALFVEASSEGVTLNGVVMVIQADIEASNGVVHIIDAVLTPEPKEPLPEPTDPSEPEPLEPTDPEPTPETP